MAKKRPSAIELARAGSSQVERMAGLVPATPTLTDEDKETLEVRMEPETEVRQRVPVSEEDRTTDSLAFQEDTVSELGDTSAPDVNDEKIGRDGEYETNVEDESTEEKIYWLPLGKIRVGGINTRVIDEDAPAFRELVESIRQDGQLEPILVGREGDHFRLIAGERRYRALRAAGQERVLARITEAAPEQWPGLMMIENLMRQDLTIWEEAAGYKALLATGLTLTEVGARVHKGKTHVSLVLKIMRNPRIVAAVEEGAVASQSMAKELAALIDEEGRDIVPGAIDKALAFIADRSPTVHELRAWVRAFLGGFQDQGATTSVRHRAARRGTFLKTEQMRLQTMLEKASEMSAVEIRYLAMIYEEHAQVLRRLSGGDARQTQTHSDEN